jgi:hypothetical protein
MRALSPTELLAVWETELTSDGVERALSLLSAAFIETPREDLAQWSIGRRDATLLQLRELAFGSSLASVESCPRCGAQLELNFTIDDVRVEPATGNEATLSLHKDNYEMQFRLPNSHDLQAIAACSNQMDSRAVLLERCLHGASQNRQAVSATQLPQDVVDAIAERMAQADPGAHMQLDLCCPACENRWQTNFDIVSFFWSEIDAWAQRLLSEVHTLARAYGWREADILNMHPHRRRFYMEKLSA